MFIKSNRLYPILAACIALGIGTVAQAETIIAEPGVSYPLKYKIGKSDTGYLYQMESGNILESKVKIKGLKDDRPFSQKHPKADKALLKSTKVCRRLLPIAQFVGAVCQTILIFLV